ncbi:MAG: hypothetical protein QOJ23_3344 [Actinomycetota bacterium]|nr:hypothetical protein [Actinomycetota bacterium]
MDAIAAICGLFGFGASVATGLATRQGRGPDGRRPVDFALAATVGYAAGVDAKLGALGGAVAALATAMAMGPAIVHTFKTA